jgi:hypothetical protein
VVKSTDCSSKGPRFKSQHPHGSSQLFQEIRYSLSHRHPWRQNTNVKKKKKSIMLDDNLGLNNSFNLCLSLILQDRQIPEFISCKI